MRRFFNVGIDLFNYAKLTTVEKSSNPALSKNALDRVKSIAASSHATVIGTALKTAILLAILGFGAVAGWRLAASLSATFAVVMLVSMIASLTLALVTIFVPKVSPFTSPLYAAAEGIMLGAISYFFNQSYPGIVVQAIGLTFAILASTLLLYTAGIVKVTAKFRAVVIIATLGIALYYVAALVLSLFKITMPLIYNTGPAGIIFSLVVVFIASLNLFLDFDFISRAEEAKMPKLFEWYGGFTLLVTLVWLYLEILRLLGKVRN